MSSLEPKLCKQCGQPFIKPKLAPIKFFCSPKCQTRATYLRLRFPPVKILEKTCDTCGRLYIADFINASRQRYCSRKCREQSPDERAYQLKKRRSPEGMEYHKNRRLRLMEYLGGVKCKHCNCREYIALHFDHINGDGKQDRARFNYSTSTFVGYYLRHLEEAKEKLQILCFRCNHKRERKY